MILPLPIAAYPIHARVLIGELITAAHGEGGGAALPPIRDKRNLMFVKSNDSALLFKTRAA